MNRKRQGERFKTKEKLIFFILLMNAVFNTAIYDYRKKLSKKWRQQKLGSEFNCFMVNINRYISLLANAHFNVGLLRVQ